MMETGRDSNAKYLATQCPKSGALLATQPPEETFVLGLSCFIIKGLHE